MAVKGNQGNLHEDIDLYFSDAKLLSTLTEKGCHFQTMKKARSQIEVRDYWVFSRCEMAEPTTSEMKKTSWNWYG
ncbi:IS1548 transposase [Streptococcus suis ST1]|nr:IS1548 transposase [Streptococcus suis ST1]